MRQKIVDLNSSSENKIKKILQSIGRMEKDMKENLEKLPVINND